MDETPSRTEQLDLVNILLCTWNGNQFLEQQLDSIRQQDYKNICLWISDDGSTDNTLALLQKQQVLFGDERFHILQGPQNGFARNFLSMLTNADIKGEYFAICDQDDIWEKNKLTRAILQLKSMTHSKALLYCSRTRLVDRNNLEIGYSNNYRKTPSFANAIVQNIAGGNTMVINKIARGILLRVSKNLEVVYHDWWIYIVVTAVGGEVSYDSYPSIRYRQHANNQIGSNTSLLSKVFRLKHLLKGRFKTWNDTNIAAIKRIENELSPQNKIVYEKFSNARNKSLLPRVIGVFSSGVYRQTFLGNIGLIAATLLKRI
jgi:glycosyltransferase involved in cell wall biosynthesis